MYSKRRHIFNCEHCRSRISFHSVSCHPACRSVYGVLTWLSAPPRLSFWTHNSDSQAWISSTLLTLPYCTHKDSQGLVVACRACTGSSNQIDTLACPSWPGLLQYSWVAPAWKAKRHELSARGYQWGLEQPYFPLQYLQLCASGAPERASWLRW